MSRETTPYLNLESEDEVEAVMGPDAGPVIIDFWGETCAPCLAMAQDFHHVAAQFEPDELKFCKVNTETHGWLAAPFHIRSIPTIVFVLDGRILDVVVGRMTAPQLGAKAEWLVGKANKKGGLLARLRGG